MIRTSICTTLILAVPGFAQIVSYDGTSFPEEEGWIRSEQVPGHLAERSLDGGWFVQNPVVLQPCPPECFTQDFYRWNLTEQAGADVWFLDWVMVTDGPPAFSAVAPASIVAAGQSGIRYHFTIGVDELRLTRGSQFPSVFHSFEPGVHQFRLELRNDPPTGTYLFTMDGEVIDAGVAEGFYPTADSFMKFGARAAVVASETRWDRIDFGPIEPEPIPAVSQWGAATLTLLTLTAATLVYRKFEGHRPLFGRAGSRRVGI